VVAAVAGQPARWPRECGAGRAPEPRIRPVRADSLSSSSLRAVGDTIPGHCAGSGNLAPSCHSVEPGRARLCFRLYCFLMTPDVSLTVVVKGFQGMAAIKQRPPKPGNTGSRVSGFIVSRQKSAPSRVAEFAEHRGPLAPDRNTAALPRILACPDRRGRWISYPCTRQKKGGQDDQRTRPGDSRERGRVRECGGGSRLAHLSGVSGETEHRVAPDGELRPAPFSASFTRYVEEQLQKGPSDPGATGRWITFLRGKTADSPVAGTDDSKR